MKLGLSTTMVFCLTRHLNNLTAIINKKFLRSCQYNTSITPDSLENVAEQSSIDETQEISHFAHLQANLESDKPIPYTFRIYAPSRSCEEKLVKCPPFYLQLDHVIAVLWSLFESDGTVKLGIGQLQWALYFLKGIKDPTEGTRSADVEIAIRAAQDALLEYYADMAKVVMRLDPPQGRTCVTCDLERYASKSTCNTCSNASLGMMGHPRKSGNVAVIAEDIGLLAPIAFPNPPCRIINTDVLANEITQLRNIAASFDIPKETPENENENEQVASQSQPAIRSEMCTDTIYSLMKSMRQEQMEKVEREMKKLKSLDNMSGVAKDLMSSSHNTQVLSIEDSLNKSPESPK